MVKLDQKFHKRPAHLFDDEDEDLREFAKRDRKKKRRTERHRHDDFPPT